VVNGAGDSGQNEEHHDLPAQGAAGGVVGSRPPEVAREKLARLAKRAGIKLKLTHAREGKSLR